MENVFITKIATVIHHVPHVLMAITLLVTPQVNVFNVQQSKIVFRVKIIILNNACSAKMVTMLNQMGLAINVLKVVRYVPVFFTAQKLLMAITLLLILN